MKAPTLNDLTDAICAYVAEHGGADEVKCRIALAASSTTLVGAIWNVADTWPEPRGAKILDACCRELLDTGPASARWNVADHGPNHAARRFSTPAAASCSTPCRPTCEANQRQ